MTGQKAASAAVSEGTGDPGWGAIARWIGSCTGTSTYEIGSDAAGTKGTVTISVEFALDRDDSGNTSEPTWTGHGTAHASVDIEGLVLGQTTSYEKGTGDVEVEVTLSIGPESGGYEFVMSPARIPTKKWNVDDGTVAAVYPVEWDSPSPPLGWPLPKQVGPLTGSGNGMGIQQQTWQLSPAGQKISVEVTAQSSDTRETKDGTLHCITTEPKMPDLRITATIPELTRSADAATERQVRLEVHYKIKGSTWQKETTKDATGKKHTKTVKKPATREETLYLPGPDANAWKTIRGTDWTVDWGKAFAGGDLKAFCEVTVGGSSAKGELDKKRKDKIWGLNPTHAEIQKRIGTNTNRLVVGYHESHFCEFYIKRSAPSSFIKEPQPVLAATDLGFGIGQLTNPEPERDMLWSWHANVEKMLAMLDSARGVAIARCKETQKTGKQPPEKKPKNPKPGPKPKPPKVKVPDLTADQLDLEMWCRYNAGWHYHNYRKSTNSWVRGTDRRGKDGRIYADRLLKLRQQVDQGKFPPNWN
jgi:hypothetical protein